MYSIICSGFWPVVSVYNEQPNVHFTYQLLVVLNTVSASNDSSGASSVANSYVTWSTFNNYNQLQMSNLRIPLVQVSVDILLVTLTQVFLEFVPLVVMAKICTINRSILVMSDIGIRSVPMSICVINPILK